MGVEMRSRGRVVHRFAIPTKCYETHNHANVIKVLDWEREFRK
jgi:hypothetical protein